MRTTQCAAFFSTVLAAAESFAAMPIDVYAINNGSSLPHPHWLGYVPISYTISALDFSFVSGHLHL